MPIQLIIFITKTKIFASEINSSGKAESISIKGNSEIRCEGRESIEELIECLYDAYNIDDFADDNFDIVIVEAGADREIISCLCEKCKGAAKLNIISIEKLLPVIVSNKNLVQSGEEIVVTFADLFYKIACDENCVIKVGKARKNEEAVLLVTNDFSFLYKFDASGIAGGIDEKVIEVKDQLIERLEKENEIFTNQLDDKNKQLRDLQNIVEEGKNENERLKKKITALQQVLEKEKGPSDNEVLKKRLDIIKKYENQIGANSMGLFYAKGNIPKKKLDEALAIVADTKIKRETVIALYCGANREKVTNILIFTTDALYFDYEAKRGCSGSLVYESIIRIEKPDYFGKVFNAAEIFLQNGKNVILGNRNLSASFLGIDYQKPLDWGLRIDVFVNLLKELSAVSETV